MKKLATAIAAVALIGTPALAADMAVKSAPRMPAPAPAWSWTGWYAGLNIGGSLGNASISENSGIPIASLFLANNTAHMSLPGVIGGGQIGYNWQVAPNWLWGIEADIQATSEKQTDTFTIPFAPVASVDTIEAKIDWLGTVRGRAGWITGPGGSSLWYVTGGYAYGKTELNAVTTHNFSSGCPLLCTAGTFSSTRSGWTIGGGLETQLWGNWTGRIEYLYVDLGTISGTASNIAAPGVVTAQINASAHITDNIVRAALNYKF
jgi:outer membrane immunogenic protein